MEWNWKEYNKEKHLFRSYYCSNCKQVKPCQLLDRTECCACVYKKEQEKAREYSDYQLVYQRKKQENKEHDRQLLLLKNYRGCSQCGSLEVDAWNLYEENRLVCQPCRMRKEGRASGAISFSEKSKWYKKRWGINLAEWLENYGCLPVNYKCAEKWLKDKEHLKKCDCLEQEAKEYYLLFSNSLKKIEEKLKDCQCEISPKIRVGGDNWTWCERCETGIPAASKKRVVKNRNDPRFWGLEIKEKILCLNCLQKFQAKMPVSKKYTFNKYLKRGY